MCLQGCAAAFKLQHLRGQVFAKGPFDICGYAVFGAGKLPEVRRKGFGHVEAAMRNPWIAALLRQILAGHHNRAESVMVLDMLVKLLAGIGLIAHEKLWRAKAGILNEQRIKR